MPKDISQEQDRRTTSGDAARAADRGRYVSMRGFGVTVVRFAIIGGFFLSGKSRQDAGSSLF